MGLLDLGKASSEARPALPASLAEKVTTDHPLLRAYLDTVLGDIITCHISNGRCRLAVPAGPPDQIRLVPGASFPQ